MVFSLDRIDLRTAAPSSLPEGSKRPPRHVLNVGRYDTNGSVESQTPGKARVGASFRESPPYFRDLASFTNLGKQIAEWEWRRFTTTNTLKNRHDPCDRYQIGGEWTVAQSLRRKEGGYSCHRIASGAAGYRRLFRSDQLSCVRIYRVFQRQVFIFPMAEAVGRAFMADGWGGCPRGL